jgi:hypothetical protein
MHGRKWGDEGHGGCGFRFGIDWLSRQGGWGNPQFIPFTNFLPHLHYPYAVSSSVLTVYHLFDSPSCIYIHRPHHLPCPWSIATFQTSPRLINPLLTELTNFSVPCSAHLPILSHTLSTFHQASLLTGSNHPHPICQIHVERYFFDGGYVMGL